MEHEEGIREMNLHGNYYKQLNALPKIDLPFSRRWTSIPYLRFETESLLCAFREQVVATNYIRAKIWGIRKSSM